MAVCMSDRVNERILIRVEQRAIMNETIYKTPSLKSDAGVNVLLIPFPLDDMPAECKCLQIKSPVQEIKAREGRPAID